MHAWLKPSSGLGLQLGILGLAVFLFMWLYPMRKTFRWLAWTGPLGDWMRIHIVAGLGLPVLIHLMGYGRLDLTPTFRFDYGNPIVATFSVPAALAFNLGQYVFVRVVRIQADQDAFVACCDVTDARHGFGGDR